MSGRPKHPWWRREILRLLEDGRSLVRSGGEWSCAGDDPFTETRPFTTRQLQVLADAGLINPDFKEAGHATRQRELPLLPPNAERGIPASPRSPRRAPSGPRDGAA